MVQRQGYPRGKEADQAIACPCSVPTEHRLPLPPPTSSRQEIHRVEEQIKRRVAIGSFVSERKLVDELVRCAGGGLPEVVDGWLGGRPPTQASAALPALPALPFLCPARLALAQPLPLGLPFLSLVTPADVPFSCRSITAAGWASTRT